MSSIGRKQYILKKLQTDGSISVLKLAEELGVSVMTIRRDLKALSDNGLVTLTHGGALLNNGSLFEYNIALKQEIDRNLTTLTFTFFLYLSVCL